MLTTINSKLQTELSNFKKLGSAEQLSFDFTFRSKNIYRDKQEFVKDMRVNGLSLGLDGIDLQSLQSDAYIYNADDEYLDTNICFHTTENNASKNHSYQEKSKGGKKNTYILCGICDPFEAYKTGKTGKKNCTMDGVTHQIDVRSPIHNFHNTLGSAYVNHMGDHHGIRRGGVKAKKPLLGFTDYKKNDFALCVICPYTHSNNEPCLSIFKFNYSGEHGYKGYFRHVKACHWAELKKGANVQLDKSTKDVKYIRRTQILPYNAHEFEQVMGEAGIKHFFNIIRNELALVQIQKAEFGTVNDSVIPIMRQEISVPKANEVHVVRMHPHRIATESGEPLLDIRQVVSDPTSLDSRLGMSYQQINCILHFIKNGTSSYPRQTKAVEPATPEDVMMVGNPVEQKPVEMQLVKEPPVKVMPLEQTHTPQQTPVEPKLSFNPENPFALPTQEEMDSFNNAFSSMNGTDNWDNGFEDMFDFSNINESTQLADSRDSDVGVDIDIALSEEYNKKTEKEFMAYFVKI